MMSNQPASINLVMQNGPTPGQVFTIQSQPQTIGRGQGSHIIIADKTLSRQHARTWATPGGLVVEDLGSTNGTFINQQRISGPTLLYSGDTLQLGNVVTFSVQGNPQETVVAGTVSDPADFGRTVRPGASGAPVYAPPARQGPSPWIWVGVAVIIAALIVGGALGYLYYSRAAQPQPTAQAVLPPTSISLPPPTSTSIPTHTPTPAVTPTPTVSPTPEPIQVPGLSAAGAEERQAPADVNTKISPFCNREIEIKASDPVLISWQRRVADDDETDYLAQWLEAAYFDLRLDGRSITDLGALNYYSGESCAENGLCGPALNWWVNVGLLEAGTHHLTMAWYTDRAISNGLDVEPVDGEMDVFGPGAAGEGFCDLVVVETTTPTAKLTPTPTPTPTATQVQQAAAPLGVFQDFESASTWKRGDQPYGQFTRSSTQVHSGSYAGQLTYNFPSVDNDYVVFIQSRRLAGRPNAISAWVYGDGASHFLNVWLKDANGQTWQMSFGQVKHTGWQEMTAFLDPGQPWPSGHISGPNNGAIDYPISFEALVLDDGSDTYSGSGTIYIDDLNSQEGAAPPSPQTVVPTTSPLPGGQPGPTGSGLYTLGIGSQHRYEEPWGAPKSGDPCEAAQNNNWDDRHPDYRGFNVELLLTNNSAVKVQDDWGENMRFFISGGQEVAACYYVYDASPEGPVPGGTSSVTFFTVVPKGQFVQVMQLNLNGQFIQICLDGSGGWSGC
jgi:hypothetical protein